MYTTSSIFPNLIEKNVLMGIRIVYTVLLTIASRWVFVKSNFSSPSWHIHNVGMISAFIGMWLVTIAHLIETINKDNIPEVVGFSKHFNIIANNFWLSGLPAYGLFLLSYFLINEQDTIPASQMNWLIIFDLVMGNILLFDNAINGIIFDINEYSLLPFLLQAVILLIQFYFYVATKGKFADQFFFVIAFLYGSYLGI